MYVSYLLDKESGMYPNTVRHPSLNLNPQNFVPAPPQYTDFTGYHPHHHHHPHVPGFNDANQTSSAYPPSHPASVPTRDDWTPYAPSVGPNPSSNLGQIGFGPPDIPPSNLQPSALLHPSISSSSSSVAPLSPSEQRRNPYEWMRRSAAPLANP
ncbi:homeobox protein CDX-1b, partial [Tachysurus ichikawai]